MTNFFGDKCKESFDNELFNNNILQEKLFVGYERIEIKYDDIILDLLNCKIDVCNDLPIQDMINTEMRSYNILNWMTKDLIIPLDIKNLIVSFSIEMINEDDIDIYNNDHIYDEYIEETLKSELNPPKPNYSRYTT